MKKFIITLFIIAFLVAILAFIFPWWIIAPICFLICYIARMTCMESFFAGFFGTILSWGTYILLKDIPNHHILSTKLAELFFLNGNYILFIILCLLLGGIVGGFSGLCGRLFNRDIHYKTV